MTSKDFDLTGGSRPNNSFNNLTVDDLVKMSESLETNQERNRSLQDTMMHDYVESLMESKDDGVKWGTAYPLTAPKLNITPIAPCPVNELNVKDVSDE